MTSELTNILALQETALQNGFDCLTIYRTMDNWSKNVIEEELLNQVKETVKSCSFQPDGLEMVAIAQKIIAPIVELPFFKRSVGIFVALDPKKPKQVELNKNLFVVFSDVKVLDSQQHGRLFSLTSLFKMTQFFTDTLCIYISRKETKFYLLNQEFTLLETMENEILEAYEAPYTGMTAGSGGFFHQGSAADEKEMKFSKTILNDVMKKLKQIAAQKKKYGHVIVFYTERFATFRDFIEDETKQFSETTPLLVQKVVDTETNMEGLFKEALSQYFTSITAEKLAKYENGPVAKYIKDLGAVISAAREGRIHKLYLKEGLQVTGYVLNNDLPYSDQEEVSEHTDQLIDWLIRKAVETDVLIYVLDPDDTVLAGNIAAVLRY